jgi:small-conductance mechanosensitive channel
MAWFWPDRLDQVLATQQQILRLLQQIITKENQMAVNLAAITAEVANNTSVSQSVVTLVQNLAAQIAAIPPSNDPVTQAALDQLTQTLTTNDGAIASAVTANTPAAPAPAPASARSK